MKRRICTLLFVSLLAGACALAPAGKNAQTVATADTSTARPVVPTLTATPVPPLVPHEWTQSEPLVIYARSRGGLEAWSQPLPMDFTLMPSGDLYLLSLDHGLKILTTRLSRQATCQLLNSIDQAGFFDYDPSSYQSPAFPTDQGDTVISVHAWRSNSVSLYDLADEIYAMASNPEPRQLPTILPSIRETFWLLDRYQPPTPLRAMELERLLVWPQLVGPLAGTTHQYIEWPLQSHTLAQFTPARYGDMSGYVPMVLTGAEATQIYDLLGHAWHDVPVQEAGKLYIVVARPLLPTEFNASPLPEISLSCSPSDGRIGIP